MTDEESAGPLPGDDLIPDPMVQWTRGAAIHASAANIWPWLVQMGYHRAGWYTSELLDRIVWRVDARNTDRILPEYQDLAVGDIVPDGPDYAAYFRVLALEPERHIVYHSIRHPYRGHPTDPTDEAGLRSLEERLIRAGTYLDFSWVFAIRPDGPRRSRLLIRTRGTIAPPAARLATVPLGLVDAYFAHTMLKAIKRRAEGARSTGF